MNETERFRNTWIIIFFFGFQELSAWLPPVAMDTIQHGSRCILIKLMTGHIHLWYFFMLSSLENHKAASAEALTGRSVSFTHSCHKENYSACATSYIISSVSPGGIFLIFFDTLNCLPCREGLMFSSCMTETTEYSVTKGKKSRYCNVSSHKTQYHNYAVLHH